MLSSLSQSLLFTLLARIADRAPRVRLERIGGSYGGWVVPAEALGPDAIVYSVGVGEDITFDLGLIERRGCTIHAFDPTPRAKAFVESHPAPPPQFRFHPYGIWREDGEVRFFAPRNPAHVSHSITNLQGTGAFFVGAVKTLRSAMEELRHAHLDLLKLDVEGAEYAVIRRMLADGIRPAALCVELEDPWPLRNLALVARLRAAGYRLVSVDGRNVTFVRPAPGKAGAR